MNSEKVLAKIVAINGKDSLGPEYKKDYFPGIDMYLFFSEAAYNPSTGFYRGIRRMHDRIIADNKLPDLSSDKMNYVSIDIKASDRNHTYMTSNKRCYQLSYDQKQFIAEMFDADFF